MMLDIHFSKHPQKRHRCSGAPAPAGPHENASFCTHLHLCSSQKGVLDLQIQSGTECTVSNQHLSFIDELFTSVTQCALGCDFGPYNSVVRYKITDQHKHGKKRKDFHDAKLSP